MVKKENKKNREQRTVPCSRLILIITIISIILAQPISAAPLTYLPLDSWVYPAISRLETLQAFEGNDFVATNTLPLTRIEVARLIDTSLSNMQRGKMKFKDTDLTLMEKLVLEFQEELTSIDAKITSLNSDTESSDLTTATKHSSNNWHYELFFTQGIDFLYPGNQSKLFSELGVKVSATISENSDLYFDYSADMDYLLDPHLTNILNTQLNQAYVNLSFPSFKITTPGIEFSNFDLMVGRLFMKWGPGYQGNLVLSDNPPPFDMVKYSGKVDLSDLGEGLGNLNFTKFFSLLDPLKGEDRYFSGQRLEYKPFDTLTLGLSETAIISYNSSLLFFNPLSFIPPYYLTRWIADLIDQPSEINSYVSLDMELNFHPGIKLYGEYMADDFILTPETNPYPNRTGFLAGAYFADPLDTGNTDFRIEYTHINNYVYFPTHPWQDYLYQGEYIGNSLGPDADQLYLELTHRLSDKFNLSLNYTHERHGEGQVGTPLPSDPVIANENIFLSGIIEEQQAYQAEISYNLSPHWALSAGATLKNITNKDNAVGEKENNTYFQFELNYQF